MSVTRVHYMKQVRLAECIGVLSKYPLGTGIVMTDVECQAHEDQSQLCLSGPIWKVGLMMGSAQRLPP